MPKPTLREGLKANRTAAASQEPVPQAAAMPATSNSRAGKTNITGYYPKAVKRVLKEIANEKDTTLEDCLAEALNDYFAKNQKPEVAPRRERA